LKDIGLTRGEIGEGLAQAAISRIRKQQIERLERADWHPRSNGPSRVENSLTRQRRGHESLRPNPTERRIVMRCPIDRRDQGGVPEPELAEERFLEQFAVLEENLVLLQNQMRSMSENAELFGAHARHIRRSVCPTSLPLKVPPTCQAICASNIQRCESFR
jgi:hypothetical protein